MRSNRPIGYLATAAIIATTSTAGAQGPALGNPEPEQKAQATPPVGPATEPPAPTAGESPTAPAARETAPSGDEAMRKIAAEEATKIKPAGPAIEFSGYTRAGVGLNVRGGKQVCFGLPGADTKWRLGNECDYVIEPKFTAKILALQDKSSWGAVVMPALYRSYEDPNGADKTYFANLPVEFKQVYFYGENIPQLLYGTVWAGRRYYDRLHLNINDQFLEIHDSDGAGVEDMHVGPGKLSAAFLMNPNSESTIAPVPTANLAPFELSARYTGIPTLPDGELQIWAGFIGSSTSEDKADPGVNIPKPDNAFRIAAYHMLGKVLGGSNLVGAKLEYSEHHLRWRAAVQQQMAFSAGRTSVDVIGEFRSAKDNDVTNNWVSLGARADTQISGPFRFLFETGIDRVFPEAGDQSQLIKATACLAINASPGPTAGPAIRLFYTHAFWNDAAQTAIAAGGSGKRLAQVYSDATNGGSFGIQTEMWW
jgi:maltoporin